MWRRTSSQSASRFIGLIEAPEPLSRAHDIARSIPRLAGISLGAEDYATTIGAKPTEETLLMPKQQVVQAARAAGIMPLGTIGSVADLLIWRDMPGS